ncbi:hypothetical protein Tco_0150470 [Tanacetum coccineum]
MDKSLRLHEGKVICVDGEGKSVFQVVKEKLTTTPILVLPDFSKVFELHMDALKNVQPVKHWRHYLFHKEFVLFTEHDSVRHIRTQDKVSHKHGRCWHILRSLLIVVKHKTCVQKSRAADALSRGLLLLVSMQVDVPGLDLIREQLTLDPYFSIVLQDVQSGQKLDFNIHDGFLFKGNQLCISDTNLHLKTIKELHGEGNVGHDRTLQLVQASYFGPL